MRDMKDKIWEDFVEESRKLMAKDETKLFDAIMDAHAEISIACKETI